METQRLPEKPARRDAHESQEVSMWKLIPTPFVLAATMTVMANSQKPETAAVNSGRDLFMTYCASCHGTSGRGNGPAAEELRHRPADLTQLARRNGGVFNDVLVHRFVDGRTVKAHGTMEMPVWGDAFKWRQGLDEDAIKARIEALVRYLESIQERGGH
jgi:mono/diheme cytochrome c family protein